MFMRCDNYEGLDNMKQNLTDTAGTYIPGLIELAKRNGLKSITIRNSEIQDNLEWESRAPIVSKAMWNNFVMEKMKLYINRHKLKALN